MDTINTQSSSQVHKKSRQGRRNEKQLSFLVDYMVQNPQIATGKFNSLHGRDDLRGSWDDLVLHLNNMRNPGVKEKDTKSWKESWRDLKTKVSKKCSALRNAKRLTGNKAITIPELTDRENKVLGLMGYEYVEGTTCPDSFPDDQFDDLERLAAGDYSILEAKPISIRPHDDNEILNDTSLNQTATENFIIEYELEESVIENSDSAQVPIEKRETPVSISKTNDRKRKLVRNENSIAKKNLRTQLGDARDVFTKLAETNAQQMDNISLSISQLAKAMSKIAENDERRLRNEENMLSVMKLLVEKNIVP